MIDPDFEEGTEGKEVERKEKLKAKWAQLKALIGVEKLGLGPCGLATANP